MIEKIITSKTRVKLLKLFLTNIDDRYYLRELERKLDESLSPLRRQLLKLTRMGILVTEEEANLKYYRLNKGFTGMEDLRRLVLGREAPVQKEDVGAQFIAPETSGAGLINQTPTPAPQPQPLRKRLKYDVAVLTAISIFVLAVASFMVYTNSRNMKQVAGLVSGKESRVAAQGAATTVTRPDEMVSRRWKLLPGNVPVLSSGVTGGTREVKEL